MAARKTVNKRAARKVVSRGKKASRKKGPAAGKKMAAEAAKEVPPMPADLVDRQWATGAQCLRWLQMDGFPLSSKNFYSHYGPKSKVPVKRDKAGQYFYPELLERVRINRGAGVPSNYDAVNQLAQARLIAETKIQEIKAQQAELALEEQRGNLLKRTAVLMVMNKFAQESEDRRKTLCANLPGQLFGRTVAEMHRILDRHTRGLFAGLADALGGMRE
jgi:hypothetical protein